MSGTPFLLLDPSGPVAHWAPLWPARSLAEARAGAYLIHERWAHALGGHAIGVIAPGAGTPINWPDRLPVVAREMVPPGTIIVRADVAPSLARVDWADETAALTRDGTPVAWRAGDDPREPPGGPTQEIAAFVLAGAWDLVTATERLLGDDCVALAFLGGAGAVPAGALVIGAEERVVVRSIDVEPGVIFDVRSGAVVIEAGAEVRSGTRLEGPCWVGPHTRIVGGFVRASAIGPWCVVRGEVSTSVWQGYANKAHDGFVGHSVIGEWVNLGAGTTTSNLKNTYGEVRLQVRGDQLRTGRQFLGTLFGDHAKTAIGTMLGTGTVVGTGANVFGGAGNAKWVPPFAWGTEGAMDVDRFVEVARRVLPRRQVEVTPALADALRALHAALTRR